MGIEGEIMVDERKTLAKEANEWIRFVIYVVLFLVTVGGGVWTFSARMTHLEGRISNLEVATVKSTDAIADAGRLTGYIERADLVSQNHDLAISDLSRRVSANERAIDVKMTALEKDITFIRAIVLDIQRALQTHTAE